MNPPLNPIWRVNLTYWAVRKHACVKWWGKYQAGKWLMIGLQAKEVTHQRQIHFCKEVSTFLGNNFKRALHFLKHLGLCFWDHNIITSLPFPLSKSSHRSFLTSFHTHDLNCCYMYMLLYTHKFLNIICSV